MAVVTWVDYPAPDEAYLVFLVYYERDDETYYIEKVASFEKNSARVWKRIAGGPLQLAEIHA